MASPRGLLVYKYLKKTLYVLVFQPDIGLKTSKHKLLKEIIKYARLYRQKAKREGIRRV